MLIVNNYNDNSNRITNNETLSYGNHAIGSRKERKKNMKKHIHTNNDNFWKTGHPLASGQRKNAIVSWVVQWIDIVLSIIICTMS